jgi:hypothetical protein
VGEEDCVRDMAAVAERLRLVRAARRKFLRLGAIEQAMVEPLLDRLAADLGAAGDGPAPQPVHDPRPQADKG